MDTIHKFDLKAIEANQFLNSGDSQKRVLLVEDSPESEDLVRHICREIDQKMHLTCVKSAEDAEKILEFNSSYDLIISDHFLSGHSTGLDLWKFCQKRFKNIPFLVTSSLETQDFFDLAEPLVNEDSSYLRFLPKPFLLERGKEFIGRQLTRRGPVGNQSSGTRAGVENMPYMYLNAFGILGAIGIFFGFFLGHF